MVTVTDSAVRHLRDVLAKQTSSDVALRLYVTAGGCSGFSYGMQLDDDIGDDDVRFEQGGVRIVVDPYSIQYLEGSQVDYVDQLMGGGFTIQNPNAAKTCSCGQSFDTAGGGGMAKPCSA
jgi:iron-sulfur cluster assembly protein